MTSDVKRVNKPWGYELHWALTDRYVGKVLHINAGHALSLQFHREKDETIYVQRGRMQFEIGPEGEAREDEGLDVVLQSLKQREMEPGHFVHVAPRTVHRMSAIDDCDVFEVSTPELDDVVRLQDRYDRKYNDKP